MWHVTKLSFVSHGLAEPFDFAFFWLKGKLFFIFKTVQFTHRQTSERQSTLYIKVVLYAYSWCSFIECIHDFFLKKTFKGIDGFFGSSTRTSTTCNWFCTYFVVQKSRDKALPKARGPQRETRERKALCPLPRNIIKKDFHSARENLFKDTQELNSGMKINTSTKKNHSIKIPADYVPVWKKPLRSGKSQGVSSNQSPQRKSGPTQCKVLRQPPMRFRL